MKMIMRFLKDYKKECVLAPLFKMLEAIFELFVPLVVSSVIDKGIVITGGGSLVDGFNLLLAQELKVPVFVAESPLTCVAEGTGVLLDNIYMIER